MSYPEAESARQILEHFGQQLLDVDVSGVTAEDLANMNQMYPMIPGDFTPPNFMPFAQAFEAMESGDPNPMISRTFAYERNQIPVEAQIFIIHYLRRINAAHHILEHEPMTDPDRKRILLDTDGQRAADELGLTGPVQPLRTLTLKMGDKLSWVSGSCTSIIDDKVRSKVGEHFELSGKKIKNAKIITSGRQYDEFSGTSPGNSSPFMYPIKASLVDGSFVVFRNEPETQAIEIQFTPDTSVIAPHGILEDMLQTYARMVLKKEGTYTFLRMGE